MKSLPPDAAAYKRTPSFDERSIPAGLLRDHATAAGVWGRIRVERGRLRYEIATEPPESFVLEPGRDGIIEPEQRHRVAAEGAVRFHVEFLRVDDGC